MVVIRVYAFAILLLLATCRRSLSIYDQSQALFNSILDLYLFLLLEVQLLSRLKQLTAKHLVFAQLRPHVFKSALLDYQLRLHVSEPRIQIGKCVALDLLNELILFLIVLPCQRCSFLIFFLLALWKPFVSENH